MVVDDERVDTESVPEPRGDIATGVETERLGERGRLRRVGADDDGATVGEVTERRTQRLRSRRRDTGNRPGVEDDRGLAGGELPEDVRNMYNRDSVPDEDCVGWRGVQPCLTEPGRVTAVEGIGVVGYHQVLTVERADRYAGRCAE